MSKEIQLLSIFRAKNGFMLAVDQFQKGCGAVGTVEYVFNDVEMLGEAVIELLQTGTLDLTNEDNTVAVIETK